MQDRLQSDQLAARHERIDGGVLEGHADHPPDVAGLGPDIATADPGRTRCGVEEGRQHPDDESEDLTLIDTQVHAIDGNDVAEVPYEARCLDNDRHALTAANPRLPRSAFIGSVGDDRMPPVTYEVERR